MMFYSMMQRILTCAPGIYMTRESFDRPNVVFRTDRQILVGTVAENRITASIPFRPDSEDMFADDWEEFQLLNE